MDSFYTTREEFLKNDLKVIIDPIERINRIIFFVESVRSSLQEGTESWIKDTLPLCRDHNYEKGLFALYTHLSFYYLMKSNYILGKSYLDRAGKLNWSDFIDSKEHMFFYHAHGLYYYFMGDKKLTFDYFEKSLELSRILMDENFSCQMLNNVSINYMDNREYQKAEEALLEAFSIINPTENPFPALKIMVNLGHLYLKLDDTDKAIDYLDSALAYSKEQNIVLIMASLNYAYGLVYLKLDDDEKAEDYFRKAYEENRDSAFIEEVPMELIRFLYQRNRREEAQDIVDNSIRVFGDKGMTTSLDKLYHLLDEYDI